jgi:transcriptional regulator with XRE-family HTH domain
MFLSHTARIEDRRRLGLVVRALRLTAGLTLKELGTLAGISGHRQSLLERGVAVFRPAELQRLMDALPALAEILQREKRPLVLGRPAGKFAARTSAVSEPEPAA